MAKYKNGQFVKVQNISGKFRVVKGYCSECALRPTNNCGKYFHPCPMLIEIDNCIKKVK